MEPSSIKQKRSPYISNLSPHDLEANIISANECYGGYRGLVLVRGAVHVVRWSAGV